MAAQITYGLFDVTAADDATQSCDDLQPFANIAAITPPDLDELVVEPWATLETNQWILDGSKKAFPNTPMKENFGLWSLSMSNSDCMFETPIILECSFTENHTTLGVTLLFREDSCEYANVVDIGYYDSSDSLIHSERYSPDSANYFASALVENYRKIVFIFWGTSLPNRYLKLTEIKFGQVKIFDDDSIIDATILEEIDPTGSELSINTLEFTAYATDFSLLDPNGVYTALQQKQTIKTKINGENFGTFFLDEPESEDDDTTTFKCIDYVGVIDQTNYMGSMCFGEDAYTVLETIFKSAGLESSEYSIDNELQLKSIAGHIPICTHREALQQVAFATGAIVDCSRGKEIKVYLADAETSGTLTHDDKFTGHKVKYTSLVTGVEVTSHEFTLSSEMTNIFEGTLEEGLHTITFSAPYDGINVDGAELMECDVNYASILVSGSSTVLITGYEYTDNTTVVGVYADELPANTKPNVISCDSSATLVSALNAAEIAQRLYDYYQNRYEDEGDIILGLQKVGQVWSMNSLNGMNLNGVIHSLEIDMLAETASVKLTGSPEERKADD